MFFWTARFSGRLGEPTFSQIAERAKKTFFCESARNRFVNSYNKTGRQPRSVFFCSQICGGADTGHTACKQWKKQTSAPKVPLHFMPIPSCREWNPCFWTHTALRRFLKRFRFFFFCTARFFGYLRKSRLVGRLRPASPANSRLRLDLGFRLRCCGYAEILDSRPLLIRSGLSPFAYPLYVALAEK